jgi:hypothetical protein
MNKVRLIILYNHRYDKNIPVLEEIYHKRFHAIYHLVPFYDGDRENVIPVYGRSIFFESYIAQGFKSFYNPDVSHYLFVADDMMLNPQITEDSYLDFFEISENQSFIPHLKPLHQLNKFWIGSLSAYFYKARQKYIETGKELPSIDEAKEQFLKQSIEIKSLKRKDIFGEFTFNTESLANKARLALRILYRLRHPFEQQFALPYPMVGGYSDIVLVAADSIKKFCHYCGVFGATGLFAEVAVPTSLVLASEQKIQTEQSMKHKGRSYWKGPGALFWESEESNEMNLEKKYKDLEDMLTNFPEEFIYIHPVKLSKWYKK